MLGRWSVAPPATAPIEIADRESAAPPDLGPLITEIRQGHDEILRVLREQPRQPIEGQPPQPRIEVEWLDRLTAAVDELNERLEAEKGPGHATLAILEDTVRKKLKLIEAGVAPKSELESELLLAHSRWRQTDLMSRYGNPARLLRTNWSLILVYSCGEPPEGEVYFRLADDRTTDVSIEILPR